MKTSIIALLILFSANAFSQILGAHQGLWHLYERDVHHKSSSQVVRDSLYDYNRFLQLDVNSPRLNPHYLLDDKKPIYLNYSQASKTVAAAHANPVVSLYQYDKYDPENRGIGFCFGRAMFTNLYLALNGLNRGSIKKAFVVGPMATADGSNWGWHVSTIVQSLDRNRREIWLAVDPITDRVLEVKAWYQEMQKMSVDGKLRLYITEAGKFEINPSRYDERHMSSRFYNDYFTDMMKWFGSNDVSRELRL